MKIIVTDRNLAPHRSRFEGALTPGCSVSWHDVPRDPSVLDDLAEAEVYVGGVLTARMTAAAPNLRLVHVAGAGTDNIAIDDLPESVTVANTFHHEAAIAEHVVATTVSLRRGIPAADRALREGRWASPVHDPAIPQPNTLQGATIGFVGFGHIGRETWRLFRAFGCEAVAVTASGSTDAGAEGLRWSDDITRLGSLLRESDVVVVAAPLTEDTRGLIGERELREVGEHGIVVNVARGPVVDERALFEALFGGIIAGAAIDVWYAYPGTDGVGEPASLPFATLPNAILTPHSSGITRQTFLGRVDDITDNIARLVRGVPLRNVVRAGRSSTEVTS